MKKYALAEAAYNAGLDHDPNNAMLLKGLEEVKPFLTGPGQSQPYSPFGNPSEMMGKLQSNPETAVFFKDPSYLKMISDLTQNPQNMMAYMQDPRMMTTLKVLTGLDLSSMGGKDTSNDNEMDTSDAPQECPMETSSKSNQMEDDTPTSAELKVEQAEDNEQEAENEKALGTAAYKAKKFDEAHTHYQKAFDLVPTNMVYLLNRGAVSLEQKKLRRLP